MHSLFAELLKRVPVLLDGATGTEMQVRGLTAGECPDGWNLTRPDAVEAVARAYVEAGSEIVLTNTFRSNRVALAGYGLADKVAALNRAGVEIARRAAGGCARVFASVGPSGKLLMTGEISDAELGEAFGEQARALAEAGADGIVIETMSDLAEAKLALAAARAAGLPVAVSMVFDSGRDRDRTMMGTTPEQVARELSAAGADIVGANCGQGIAGYASICRRLRASTDRPLWIKPNAGTPEMVEGKVVYTTTPEEFAGYASGLVEAGASFLGGCCGTSPEFIRALAVAVGQGRES